jgi:hypothetical protein
MKESFESLLSNLEKMSESPRNEAQIDSSEGRETWSTLNEMMDKMSLNLRNISKKINKLSYSFNMENSLEVEISESLPENVDEEVLIGIIPDSRCLSSCLLLDKHKIIKQNITNLMKSLNIAFTET